MSKKEEKIPCPGCGKRVGNDRGIVLHYRHFPECVPPPPVEDTVMVDPPALSALPAANHNEAQAVAAAAGVVEEDNNPSDDDDDFGGGGGVWDDDEDNAWADDEEVMAQEEDEANPDEEEEEEGELGADIEEEELEVYSGIITDLQEKLEKYLDSGHGSSPISFELQAKIDLLCLLKLARAPFYLFQDIWKWAQKQQDRNVKFKSAGTRASVLKELHERYNLEDTVPITQHITLPECKKKVQITTHGFLPQLYSMLTDPALMKDQNLLFCGEEEHHPFGVPVARRGAKYVVKDIVDGSVYRQAHQKHVQVANRDLLVPIILYIDKTHVDRQSRLCLEPVTFTLGIFTKEARKSPLAWRPLGYIVNQSNLGEGEPLGKAKDYHFMLSHILHSLKQAQVSTGIGWGLKYKGITHQVVMKIPIIFVIGDTEGHDKLCGKFLSRSKLVKCYCRYCDCPAAKTGNAHAEFSFTKASAIARLCQQEDQKGATEQLRLMSYHCLNNAFTGLTFCDPSLGINGATVAEVLHLLQHGIFLYFGQAFFGAKAITQSSMRKSGKKGRAGPKGTQGTQALTIELFDAGNGPGSDEGCDVGGGVSDGEYSSDDSLSDRSAQLFDENGGPFAEFCNPSAFQSSTNGVFGGKVLKEFNSLAQLYGSLLCHQSDREYDRAYFVAGISKSTKKNGHEERCVLLLCLIILCSNDGKSFDKQMGTGRCSLYVLVITLLLLLENFFRSHEILKEDISNMKHFMPIFLSLYKKAVARVKGMGMNFVKFHLLLHLSTDLLKFGPSSSTDSSAGESMHKDYKDDARRTQKNIKTLDHQTARNHCHSNAIDRAIREVTPPQNIARDCSGRGRGG